MGDGFSELPGAAIDQIVARNRGNYSIIQALLDSGTPIDTANKTGNTPLQLAVKGGFRKTADLLLRSNADVTHANLLGETALDIAKSENNKHLVNLIKSYAKSSGILDQLLSE